MNREQIEKLAMDFASGELNEDVEALLQEYLAEHKEAYEWFLEMQDICRKTQDAFDTKIDVIKQSPKNKLSLKYKFSHVLHLAAAIIISACIGIAAGRWSKSTVSPKTATQQIIAAGNAPAKQSDVTLDEYLNNLEDGFWRDKVAAMINPSPARVNREKSSGPSLLEQYKQYLKEKKS